jgi:hypothetical protein
VRLVPIFPDGDQPGFNREAALNAYEWALSNPEEAVTVAKALALDEIAALTEKHYEVIQKAVDKFYIEQVEVSKRALKRVVVSKAARGEDVDEYVAMGDELSKAAGDMNFFERQRKAQGQWRDPRGRWRTMNVKIARSGERGAPLGPNQTLPPAVANRMGVSQAEKMPSANRNRLHNAYLQVAEALDTVADIDPKDVITAYKFKNPRNGAETVKVHQGNKPVLDEFDFEGDNDLEEIEVNVDPTLTAGGATFDLVSALGGGFGTAGAVTSAGAQAGGAASKFRENWRAIGDGQFGAEQDTRARDFQNIGNASQLIGNALGSHIGPAGRFATTVGNWVGTHGPQAEEVLGPGTRKLSYRYRGVEKRPDPELQDAIDQTMSQIAAKAKSKEAKVEVTDKDKRRYKDAAHEVLVYGPLSEYGKQFGTKDKDGKPTGESPLITRMIKDLPDMGLARLQLESGHVPPSHGVIIDRKGVVTTQAVGYGDDWYLPFNLKTIGQVNGGEYVRTRTLGGPTSEDIYTALITEARGITVVSHSGIYNIEFDKTFRGGRRFNDKARRMVDRYEKLLDAVKEGQVSPNVPVDRLRELNATVAATGMEGQEASDYFQSLKAEEGKNPKMSVERIAQVRDRWINEVVAQGMDPDFTMDDLKEEYVNKRSTQILAEKKAAPAVTSDPDWDALAADVMSDRPDSFQALNEQLGEQTGSSPEAMGALKASEAYRVAQEGVSAADKRETARIEAAREFEADPIAALEFTHKGTAERWNTELGRAQYEYRQAHRGMQLDANGYRNALKALQEQFPYYIKRTEWRPLPGGDVAHTGTKDTGYVMPRYNRPTAAKAGYHQRLVTGAGKISAAETGYQNNRVRLKMVNQGSGSSASTDEQYVAPGSGGNSFVQRNKKAQEAKKANDARYALYAEVTAKGKHYASIAGNPVIPVHFDDPAWRNAFVVETGRDYPISFGLVSEFHKHFSGYTGPSDRTKIPGAKPGVKEPSPLTEAEFSYLASNVPGFTDAAFEEAESLNAYLKDPQGNVGIDQNKFNVAGNVGPSGQFQEWSGADVPDVALTDPRAVFAFKGDDFKSGKNPKMYEATAKNKVRAIAAFQVGAGVDLEVAKIDPASPFMDAGLDDKITGDLITVLAKIGNGGDSKDQQNLIKELHQLRALTHLRTGANMQQAAIGNAPGQATSIFSP